MKTRNKCKICNKSVRNSFCSVKCRKQWKLREQIKEKNLKENDDYVVCKWDGGITFSSIKKYINNNFKDRTWDDYIKEFPSTLLQPVNYTKKTSKNSGVHMKTEKYKKLFSDRFSGKNNPNHSSRASEDVRKSRSPFSKNFTKYKTEEDRKNFLKTVNYEDRLTSTNLDWWIVKFNGDEALAKAAYKERQRTFTLEKCIAKYGEIEGKKRFAERQEKWFKNYKKSNFSKISQTLYWKIYEVLKDEPYTFYFAQYNNGKKDTSGKNNEYTLKLCSSSIKPDFFIPELKLIIEFDGEYWHRRDKEIIEREQKRDKMIIDAGYTVIHIKEKDYKLNPENEINRCLSFIRGKN